MKSVEELIAIKASMQDKIAIRKHTGDTRIIVGMGTCGIAAGARPVLAAFVEGIANAGLGEKVVVMQTGCLGDCDNEPMVEVLEHGKEKVTYVKMTPEKAAKIIEQHIRGGEAVVEYTVGAAK